LITATDALLDKLHLTSTGGVARFATGSIAAVVREQTGTGNPTTGVRLVAPTDDRVGSLGPYSLQEVGVTELSPANVNVSLRLDTPLVASK